MIKNILIYINHNFFLLFKLEFCKFELLHLYLFINNLNYKLKK